MVTEQLVPGGVTQTDHGVILHDDVIGRQPGTVVVSVSSPTRRGSGDENDAPDSADAGRTDPFDDGGPDGTPEGTMDAHRGGAGTALRHDAKPWKASRASGGWSYVVMRPRMVDFVLSMPRGAQIMYPKDIAQTISLGDVRRGMRVLESGAGSGAMSIALLEAVGPEGALTSIEMRPEFARVAQANATVYFGSRPRWWNLVADDFDSAAARMPDDAVDRIVLDMLDPWNRLDEAWRVLAPGGVLVAYVTTTTQLSRLADGLRSSGHWTEPDIGESLERGWKAEGLAVRPRHDMIGHTGFLVVTRAMAEGAEAPARRRRATKGSAVDIDSLDEDQRRERLEELELRDISDRKLRKVLRDLDAQVRRLPSKGEPA
ncbi:tRNA (adenine-N1)-methyltransferase [uncultured Bifidobacterium sp.]|uniref:tRNA (adenine-N1)-methyltransferase n=1 Tax=uncultured Bifidobacterium sp. TaxID=165187 RepID=UPI0037DCE505